MIDRLSPSAKAFSEAIGESPTNTHNYVSARNAEPRANYLAKVIFHFANVNARWLLTGQGGPFTSEVAEPASIYQNVKKNSGNVLGSNHGSITMHYTTLADCEQDLKTIQERYAQLETQVDLLTSQLVDKERIIRLYEAKQSPSH